MTCGMLPHTASILLVALNLRLPIVNALPVQPTLLAIKQPVFLFLQFFEISLCFLHLRGKMAFRQSGFFRG